MKADNFMKIQFISKSCNESFARTAVAAFTSQLDPDLAQLNEIKTAVSEAVTNSIVHGYREELGTIYITAKITKGKKLTVTVRDSGCGIEDVKLARTALFTTGNPDERAGMGFTVMEAYMDSVKVYSKLGKGTRVVMTKTIESKE